MSQNAFGEQPAKPEGEDPDHHPKRTAYSGQWRTPPNPLYPSTTPILPIAEEVSKAFDEDELAWPNSTDDYAAALQDAYRRGAQAALAAQQQARGAGVTGAPPLLSSASCPEFQHPRHHPRVPAHPILPAPVVPNPLARPQPFPPSVPNTSDAAMPPPPPPRPFPPPPVGTATMAAGPNSSNQPLAPSLQLVTPIASPNPPHFAPPLPPPPPPPPHSSHPIAAGPVTSSSAGGGGSGGRPPLAPPPRGASARAASLPDLRLRYDPEEEKRQKRLARNRASARLRRLRKKNLVEAYEVEVTLMEKTLEDLKKHEWGKSAGNDDRPTALLEALSMDRGQQPLTDSERRNAARDLLDQQLEFLDLLEEELLEQSLLYRLHEHRHGELKDLQDAVQLTDEQFTLLAEAATGWDDEWRALQTLKASLRAMRNSDWLWSTGSNAIVQGFLSILSPTQLSKFLLWTDHNSESIDDLDGINAKSEDSPDHHGPIFQFGVSSNPDSLLDGSGKAGTDEPAD